MPRTRLAQLSKQGKSSTTLADLDAYKELCDRVNSVGGFCNSISMHDHLEYAYLFGGCLLESTVEDPADEVWTSHVHHVSDAGGRRMAALDEYTWPLSFGSLLRFKNLKATSGGTFKVCACDHSVLTSNVCRTKADYQFEIGKLHSSGVSCLVSNPKFQQTTCVQQFENKSTVNDHFSFSMRYSEDAIMHVFANCPLNF